MSVKHNSGQLHHTPYPLDLVIILEEWGVKIVNVRGSRHLQQNDTVGYDIAIAHLNSHKSSPLGQD